MLKLKRGVRIAGIRPECVLAMNICADIYAHHGQDCIVTSGGDPPHGLTSLHWAGSAFDLRTRNLTGDLKEPVTQAIKAALGRDFDVLFEHLGELREHLHIEFQPRRPE